MTRNAVWLSHFGLKAPPFTKSLEDMALWLPNGRSEIVNEIVQAIHERHHILLVGEPGVGKTCTLRAVRHQLPESQYRLNYYHNATLGRRDFYRQICITLNLTTKSTAADVFLAINTHIKELGEESIHPVLLLDEAHLLHQDVLEHLHILTNYCWDSKPLLSIILVGLPDLWGRLKLAKNRSLWSRIQTRLTLAPSQPEDTNEYIEYRLEQVGCPRSLFASDALALLHESTEGRLRDIDRLATLALQRAARRKLKIIDRALMSALLENDARPAS